MSWGSTATAQSLWFYVRTSSSTRPVSLPRILRLTHSPVHPSPSTPTSLPREELTSLAYGKWTYFLNLDTWWLSCHAWRKLVRPCLNKAITNFFSLRNWHQMVSGCQVELWANHPHRLCSKNSRKMAEVYVPLGERDIAGVYVVVSCSQLTEQQQYGVTVRGSNGLKSCDHDLRL